MEISIIIPVYNKEDYVKDCLASTLAQDFFDYEVIAVDDGSNDKSGIICDTIAKECPRLKVYHIANSGVTAARRYGVKQAKGKYITFVDSDDKLLPHALSTMYSAITNNDADEIIATYMKQDGTKVSTGRRGIVSCELMVDELLQCKAKFCVLWAVLFKKELLDSCLDAPASIRSAEDIFMQIKCLMKSPKAYFIEDCVYLYNMGLPNDRTLNIEEAMLYDDILKSALKPKWNRYENSFHIHQIKTYENFINQKSFYVYPYYKHLKAISGLNCSLGDKTAIMLPPRISYFLIAFYKRFFVH